MKKLVSVIIMLAMFFSISTTILAADNTYYQSETMNINEYDYLVMLQNSTPAELSNLNMTEEDVNATIEAFYKAIAKRAELSNDELIRYGYTLDEIEIFRTYNYSIGGNTDLDSNFSTELKSMVDTKYMTLKKLRAIAGTLTGKIKLDFCGTKYATFHYEWSWNHSPLVLGYDSVAMRWLAYDSKGHEIDVMKTSETSKIDHYVDNMFVFSRAGQPETNLDFNSVNMQFKVEDFYSSPKGNRIISTYAKKGLVKISLKVDDNVKNKINYIKVAALYGHTIVGINFPSISLSPTGSISIGFSGNISIDALGGHKVKIGAGSSIKDI